MTRGSARAPSSVLPAAKSAASTDALCLGAIIILSALPYVADLGFYSDDWALLAAFQSVERTGSLLDTALENFAGRPVQGLYLTLLFTLFGLDPLGHHIVNTAVIAASVSLLYLLLLRLRFGRAESFAVALLFAMLPQLSTVRVWYAAFHIPLSMLLMLASLHCQLSFARWRTPGWLVAALAAAALSIGAYEIFAPLLAGFALALLLATWRERQARRATGMAAILVVAAILLAVLYKLAFSGRAGAIGDPQRYLLGLYQLIRADYDWRFDSGLNIFAAPFVHFWLPVRGWATGAIAVLGGRWGLLVVVIAVAIAILAWWRITQRQAPHDQAPLQWMLLAGIAVFLLGHATFLLVPAIVFTPTGIGNRVQVAAAIGVAMILVSAISLAVKAIAPARRRAVFALIVAATSAAAFVRLAEIERYWAQAPRLQETILSAAEADLEGVPAGSTIILDGTCPYHGPAIVFEAPWDVGAALSLALGRPLAGDVVSPRMSLSATGLETSIYKEPAVYRYAPTLYVYDPRSHLLVRLDDLAAARRYFQRRNPPNCREGNVARGVEI